MPKSATGTSAAEVRSRRPPARGPARHSGFTLFEMLVVLAIIGLVAAGILLSLNLGSKDPALHTAARRLVSLMRYARSKAELETRDYGIVFEPTGYAFVVFSERHNQWRMAHGDSALRARHLPHGVHVTVVVDARQVKLPSRLPKATTTPNATSAPGAAYVPGAPNAPGAIAPQVVLYSSGDLSSFAVTVRRAATQRGFLIKPNEDGRITERALGAHAQH